MLGIANAGIAALSVGGYMGRLIDFGAFDEDAQDSRC